MVKLSTVGGWTVESYDNAPEVFAEAVGERAMLSWDADGFTVSLKRGGCQYDERVPEEVILKMLEARGYEVTKK